VEANMLTLNKKSEAIVKKRTGLDIEELIDTDFCTIDENIEKKAHHKLRHMSGDDDRLHGRGSVYIYLNRLLNMKEIDKKLSRI
jgi:hypothetical protein